MDGERSRMFWQHHEDRQTPGLSSQKFAFDKCEPFSIYGDEAEYTVSKEKVLVIFGRYLGNA